jgi:hypothetical protein
MHKDYRKQLQDAVYDYLHPTIIAYDDPLAKDAANLIVRFKARIADLEEQLRLQMISEAESNDRIAKLEGFVAAYDALRPAIHSGDNDKIVRAIAVKDAARKALESDG